MNSAALTRYQAGLAVLAQTMAVQEQLAAGLLETIQQAGQASLSSADSAVISQQAIDLLAAEEAVAQACTDC